MNEQQKGSLRCLCYLFAGFDIGAFDRVWSAL